MENQTKPNKQKQNHPWKKPLSITNAVAQKAVRKELEKRGIK